MPSYHAPGAAPNPKSGKTPFFVIGGGILALIVAIGMLASIAPTQNPGSSASTSAPSNSAITNAAPAAPANWVYDVSKDAMQKGATKTACTLSNNEVSLSFPYHDTAGRLCIRDWPGHGLDSYVELNGDGQILCGIESCAVRIRFDDAAARSFPAVGAADNSSNIIFIRRTPGLIEALRRSSKATVELTFFQNGVQTLSFNTTGLKWPPHD